MLRSPVYLAFAVSVVVVGTFSPTFTLSDRDTAFYPTWKLLSDQEKRQFISGYLQGWRDAAKVTDIAIHYVKTNPSEAVTGLEGIKSLYNLEGIRSEQAVQAIDLYFSDPENHDAPLSRAVTAARKALKAH
jgi:hypothetical protein